MRGLTIIGRDMRNKPKEVDEGDDRHQNADWPYYTERSNTWSWSKWKEVFGRGRDDDD